MTQFALTPVLRHRSMSALASPLRFSVLPRAPGTFVAVLLAHAVALGLLLMESRAPQPAALPTPLFVRLIEPAATPPMPATTPPPLQAPTPPPRPAPAPKPAPTLTPSPTPQPVAPSTPTPRPPEPAAEAPRVEPAPAAPPTPAETPRPAPPLVQPRFNADYLDNPKPPYPTVSRRMGEEGEVRLKVLVDAGGNAQQVEIEHSSGYPRLDQAALDTVKRWRFVPARQGDQPIAAWVIVPIQFSLRS